MRWRIGALCVGLAMVSPLAGQDVDPDRLDLPLTVAQEVVAFFGDPATTVVEGDMEIAAGEFVSGPLAVMEGDLSLLGTVEGDVMVINGDVVLGENGGIEGELTIIGGRYRGEPAQVSGEVMVFVERYDFERRERRIDDRDDDEFFSWDSDRRPWTRSRISTRSEVNYNRVEGLPIMVGPVYQTGRTNEFRIDALGIYRTESGFKLDADDLGYFLRVEQSFGRYDRLTLAGTAHSMIEPLDRWRLDDFEASMATLLLHKDYRDYYEREGFGLAARVRVPDAGVFLEFEYLDETHAFAPARDPFAFGDDDKGWRAQPLVGEGELRAVSGEVTVDARNERENPSDGWYLSAKAVFGVDGDLSVPAYLQPTPRPSTLAGSARPVSSEIRSGFIDLRRHTRLGPDADFSLRAMWAGSIDGEPLPPQFQHTLGGVGSLPGHPLMSIDCGARGSVFSARLSDDRRVPAYPTYGCDRVGLVQAQYRGTFSIDFGDDDDFGNDWDWYPAVDFSPSWTVFMNAGRGWSLSSPGEPGFFEGDTETFLDAGVGFYAGGVGLYWAWPLQGGTGSKKGNFFIRLEHRF